MPRRAGRTRQCGVERYSTPHCRVRPRCGAALTCAFGAFQAASALLWGSRAAAGSWALRLCGSGDGVGTRARQARVLLDGTRRDAIDRWFHHHLIFVLILILPPYPFSARAHHLGSQHTDRQTVVRQSGPAWVGRSGPAPAAPAGRRRAATWQAAAAVSGPGNSLERQEGRARPSASRAMRRVSRALPEQRGEGCEKLDERRASQAACLSCGPADTPSRYMCTMRTGELGRQTISAG